MLCKTLQEHLFQTYPTWYNIGNYSNRNTNI